ncbi:hypothetical protein V9L05_17790 [Bernardetia sp. Wsw4-3y2]|uniref:hypothetical protein n=1 Tax=Bernardetia sp. Wsw4-3y2 TaxID=3127471 RepID=UPI0030D0829C
MNDIAKCAGLDCAIKETCKRFTISVGENEGYFDVEDSAYWVYPDNKVSVVEKNRDCDFFYPNPPVPPKPRKERW